MWQRISCNLQSLFTRPLTLFRRRLPHLGTTQLGVPERQPLVRLSQHFLRSWLTVLAEEEARRIDNVGMTPSIRDETRDVAASIEAAITEHPGKLPEHGAFDGRIAH